MIILFWAVIALGWGAYFLFRDTMNKIQYLSHLGIYWITRNTGEPDTPHIKKAWMRQTAQPYWRGRGLEFRIGLLTFQVGRLTMRVDSLDSQLSSSDAFDNLTVKELRTWQRPGLDEEAS